MVSAHFTSLNIGYVFLLIYNAFFHTNISYISNNITTTFLYVWHIIMIAGYTFSIIALLLIIYLYMRISEIRRREKTIFGPFTEPQQVDNKESSRIQRVRDLISSDNQNDWRQAIIEADIILEETLTKQGYHGETIGEQLKQAVQADFRTLNDAWEAHKVRNEIAHQGSSFELSETLAHDIIAKYENVFHEFNVI